MDEATTAVLTPWRTVPTAFRGYLMSAGVDPEAAWLLERAVERLGLLGLDPDGLAGVLLRSASQCRREGYREGYEDAGEISTGNRQSPLILPAEYGP